MHHQLNRLSGQAELSSDHRLIRSRHGSSDRLAAGITQRHDDLVDRTHLVQRAEVLESGHTLAEICHARQRSG